MSKKIIATGKIPTNTGMTRLAPPDTKTNIFAAAAASVLTIPSASDSSASDSSASDSSASDSSASEEEERGASTASLEQDDSDIGPSSENSTTQMDLGLSATEAFARQKMRAVAGKPKDLPLKSAIKFDWGEVPSSMSKPGGGKQTLTRHATLLQEALTATHAITTEQCKAGNKLITEKKKLNDLLEKQHLASKKKDSDLIEAQSSLTTAKSKLKSAETELKRMKKRLDNAESKASALQTEKIVLQQTVSNLKKECSSKGRDRAGEAQQRRARGHPTAVSYARDGVNLAYSGDYGCDDESILDECYEPVQAGSVVSRKRNNSATNAEKLAFIREKNALALEYKRNCSALDSQKKADAEAKKMQQKKEKSKQVSNSLRLLTDAGAVNNGQFSMGRMMGLGGGGQSGPGQGEFGHRGHHGYTNGDQTGHFRGGHGGHYNFSGSPGGQRSSVGYAYGGQTGQFHGGHGGYIGNTSGRGHMHHRRPPYQEQDASFAYQHPPPPYATPLQPTHATPRQPAYACLPRHNDQHHESSGATSMRNQHFGNADDAGYSGMDNYGDDPSLNDEQSNIMPSPQYTFPTDNNLPLKKRSNY
eukprot:CAMPEP_0181132586 /NCGR_PEP_ID=MMETSP1071-20121207/31071_1 /TAXON_ID=35127 /ORGANISM="Thalassiosira sp., Strain NH16" /LENGTH=588 /DNA_ID=CAMNT_0023218923 /DNA_START=183 /DNA_END=1951 /DNA_ORIENTATION=-